MKKMVQQVGLMKIRACFFIFISYILLFSCNSEKPKEITKIEAAATPQVPTPDFNSDSAYYFVKQQVDFGPRIPGTDAHAKCAEYLVQKLKQF